MIIIHYRNIHISISIAHRHLRTAHPYNITILHFINPKSPQAIVCCCSFGWCASIILLLFIAYLFSFILSISFHFIYLFLSRSLFFLCCCCCPAPLPIIYAIYYFYSNIKRERKFTFYWTLIQNPTLNVYYLLIIILAAFDNTHPFFSLFLVCVCVCVASLYFIFALRFLRTKAKIRRWKANTYNVCCIVPICV